MYDFLFFRLFLVVEEATSFWRSSLRLLGPCLWMLNLFPCFGGLLRFFVSVYCLYIVAWAQSGLQQMIFLLSTFLVLGGGGGAKCGCSKASFPLKTTRSVTLRSHNYSWLFASTQDFHKFLCIYFSLHVNMTSHSSSGSSSRVRASYRSAIQVYEDVHMCQWRSSLEHAYVYAHAYARRCPSQTQ